MGVCFISINLTKVSLFSYVSRAFYRAQPTLSSVEAEGGEVQGENPCPGCPRSRRWPPLAFPQRRIRIPCKLSLNMPYEERCDLVPPTYPPKAGGYPHPYPFLTAGYPLSYPLKSCMLSRFDRGGYPERYPKTYPERYLLTMGVGTGGRCKIARFGGYPPTFGTPPKNPHVGSTSCHQRRDAQQSERILRQRARTLNRRIGFPPPVPDRSKRRIQVSGGSDCRSLCKLQSNSLQVEGLAHVERRLNPEHLATKYIATEHKVYISDLNLVLCSEPASSSAQLQYLFWEQRAPSWEGITLELLKGFSKTSSILLSFNAGVGFEPTSS